ncbi:hypothetical protein LTR15_010566 [Elasticomyces elasticus]|nr:hypothetical protein LTR15_010566 [Elasticomyces elasticus]
MKLFSIILALPSLAQAAQYSDDDYRSGRVHEMVLNRKESQESFARHKANGDHDSRKWPSWSRWGQRGNWRQRNDHIKCRDGLAVAEAGNANQTFRCNNVDMYDFKSHADLGSWGGEGSDTWGWISDTGREFVAIGQFDGTAFAEITNKGKLVYLGRLPQQSVGSVWRDMKGFGHYLVVGSEAIGSGVQIFDWTKLLNLDPASPKNFSTTSDLTGFYDGLPVGRSHNLVINEELGYGVAVGAAPRNDSCAAGLIFLDLSDPTNPTSPGCAGQDGYVHDAQCLVYHGPDTKYEGVDICYGFNEDTLTIYDVTNKTGFNTSKVISKTTYEGASYTHQGWVLDKDWQDILFLNDELDELDGAGLAANGQPVTYIFDISSLEAPIWTGYYHSSNVKSIDHNMYVQNGLTYQSNYGSGLRIWDVSGVREDPTGGNVEEVAFFDIYPEDDHLEGGGEVEFVGTWGNVPFFPSGFIFVNTIERGGFVLKMSKFSKQASGKWWKRRMT